MTSLHIAEINLKRLIKPMDRQIYGVKKDYSNLLDLDAELFYDANNNIIADLDHEILMIKYNSLNLSDTVRFRIGNQIINCYAADWTKLFTLLTPVTVPITKGEVCKWEYQLDVINQDTRMFADNYEYTFSRDPDPETHNDYYSLTRIGNSEGYAHFGANPRAYYYYYRKDHLGNNREVWRAHDKRVVQRTQYYPSGLPWGESEGTNVQPYKYNGKEFIEMHGYDTYDYEAREYYPAIMRFTTMDPLAEKGYYVSPYVYCHNNPMLFIDPDGRWPDFPKIKKAFGDFVQTGKKWVNDNGKTITKVSQTLQDLGDGASLVGYGLTLSGVFSEVGVPLSVVGSYASSIGSGMELGVAICNEDITKSVKKTGFIVGGKVIEKAVNKILPGAGKKAGDLGGGNIKARN